MPERCEFETCLMVLMDDPEHKDHVYVTPAYGCVLEGEYNIACPANNRYCKYKESCEQIAEMIAVDPDDVE